MSYEIYLYVDGIKKINRTIIVNDNIPIQLFIKSLIVTMNGDSDELSYLVLDDVVVVYEEDELLKTLKLKVGDVYQVIYDYCNKQWRLEFKILKKNSNLNDKLIEIIAGSRVGICPNEFSFLIERLLKSKDKEYVESELKYSKTLNTYFNSKFSLVECNQKLDNYVLLYQEMHKPKRIEMNISLSGYSKEIKRKIVVNNNILIDQFCRCVIVAFNGGVDHLYTIKKNKKWYDENILYEKLNYLDLEVGKKFKVIYDYGDDWEFDIKISKIIDGYNDKKFEIIKSCGYGIVEDCGGAYRLSEYLKDKKEKDIKVLQHQVNKALKIENFHEMMEEYY